MKNPNSQSSNMSLKTSKYFADFFTISKVGTKLFGQRLAIVAVLNTHGFSLRLIGPMDPINYYVWPKTAGGKCL